MVNKRRINLLAACIIAVGGVVLSAPAGATAVVRDGCSDAEALVAARRAACPGTFSGTVRWCNATEYSVVTSCSYQILPPP
jgi:hypothetical protein